jgi:hypothetical protein
VLEREARFRNDLPLAWAVATKEQRILARLLLGEIPIKDDWVAAVQPRPSFLPFFNLDSQV